MIPQTTECHHGVHRHRYIVHGAVPAARKKFAPRDWGVMHGRRRDSTKIAAVDNRRDRGAPDPAPTSTGCESSVQDLRTAWKKDCEMELAAGFGLRGSPPAGEGRQKRAAFAGSR